MNAPIFVTPPPVVPLPDAAPAQAPGPVPQLLRQLIGLQQETVGLLKAQLANQDNSNRWKAFLARWSQDFPNVGQACKHAVPVLERAYLTLLTELTERVNTADAGELENEFTLGDFLDRFGIRLGQLGNIIGQLGPIADAAPNPPPAAEDKE